MKIRRLPWTVALALGISTLAASAQSSAPQPAVSASAVRPVPAGKPGPRLLSPAKMNENASPPGELRPESPVTPQIVIPLRNKEAPYPNAGKPALRPVRPAPSGSVDDAVARCNALSDASARAACRDKIEH